MSHEDWGEGPWNNEEDHAVWVDPVTDLDCMINRGPSGALCGYVGVDPDHPLHGKDYTDVDDRFDVHGGLTYSDGCQGEICHVPEPGREHDIWWFGFDCAHSGDVMPAIAARLREMAQQAPALGQAFLEGAGTFGRDTYKDWAYVSGEIRNLATQLKAMQ